VSARIESVSTPGTALVVFRGPAVPGTLAAFTGVLTLHGLDILSATIVRQGDEVEDTFEIRMPPGGAPGADELQQMADEAAAAVSGARDLHAELRSYRRGHTPVDFPPEVEVVADGGRATGFQVRAADRPGLLHDLAATLSLHGMRTRAVSVITVSGVALDTFRVVDSSGSPPIEPGTIESVRAALLEAARD
jgi:[protein-PII] uridylyltransferase